MKKTILVIVLLYLCFLLQGCITSTTIHTIYIQEDPLYDYSEPTQDSLCGSEITCI